MADMMLIIPIIIKGSYPGTSDPPPSSPPPPPPPPPLSGGMGLLVITLR